MAVSKEDKFNQPSTDPVTVQLPPRFNSLSIAFLIKFVVTQNAWIYQFSQLIFGKIITPHIVFKSVLIILNILHKNLKYYENFIVNHLTALQDSIAFLFWKSFQSAIKVRILFRDHKISVNLDVLLRDKFSIQVSLFSCQQQQNTKIRSWNWSKVDWFIFTNLCLVACRKQA